MSESISSKLREWANTNGSICGAEDVIDSLRRYLSVLPCPEWSDDVKAIDRYIADQIEAEQKAIIEAQSGGSSNLWNRSPHHIMRTYAEGKGKPMEDGESITEWLNRYYVPLEDAYPWPKDSAGNPIKIGKTYWGADGKAWNIMSLKPGMKYDVVGKCGGRVNDHLKAFWLSPEPPAPKILTANGVPIEKGMTVYVTKEHARDCGHRSNMAWLCRYRFGDPITVLRAYPSGSVALDREKDISCPASWLTTERPDCQERIDEDKGNISSVYWGCRVIDSCSNCPTRIDGERPRDHYGVKNCTVAQGMDLARRQAELDALLGDGTVHCKDCASSQEDGHLCYRFAQGVYDEDEGADVITPVEVEPEGSCSWGRRR